MAWRNQLMGYKVLVALRIHRLCFNIFLA